MRKKLGFTLIEVVVVVAILGILAGLAIPRYVESSATAKGVKLLGDLRTIDDAVMLYEVNNGNQPTLITDLLTATGTPPRSYLAAEPLPPDGKFVITKTSGTMKEYNSAAQSYLIVDGRAVYTSAEGSGSVEWYLSDDSSSIGDRINDIVAAMVAVNKQNLDSGALTVQDTFSEQVVAALAAKGIDLNALGATSWHYEKGKALWFSTVDISSLAVGTQVPIVQYNLSSGNYTVWKANIAEKQRSQADGTLSAPYKVISPTNSDYKSSTTKGAEWAR